MRYDVVLDCWYVTVLTGRVGAALPVIFVLSVTGVGRDWGRCMRGAGGLV